MLDPALHRVVVALVDEVLAHLEAGDLAAARTSLAEAQQVAPHDAAVLRAQGELDLASGRPRRAREAFAAAVTADPRDAEAHHALGCLLEEAGQTAAMVEHFVTVLRLDAAADRREGVGGAADLASIERTAEAVLDGLPGHLAARLAGVPVVLEARPSLGLVRDGLDPRTLGLFEGSPDGVGAHGDASPELPPRIVLYYANLLAQCPDDVTLAEQVEVTLLHEIGHFFGLDEDGVAALGLA